MSQIVAILTGVLFIACGAYLARGTLRLFTRGYATTGTVISVIREINTGSGSVFLYRPVVRFRTTKGQKKTFTNPTGSSRPYAVGQTVRIRYDPSSNKAQVDTFLDLWVFPGIVLGGGIFIVVTLIRTALQ